MVRVFFIILGALTALLAGGVARVTLGTAYAVVCVVSVLAVSFYAAQPDAKARKLLRTFVAALCVFNLVFIAYQTTSIVAAFQNTSGPVDPADERALSSAHTKFEKQVEDQAAFRLELTEVEITALLQSQLEAANTPFQRVVLDIVGGENGDGYVEFNATFRDGETAMRGRFKVFLNAGALQVELLDVDVGVINIPKIAKNAVEDLINPFADEALANGADIQSVELANDKVIVVGTVVGGNVLSSETLLANLRRQAAKSAEAIKPPPERIGPGLVNGRETEGSSYYVALGDSLAANVGVRAARSGYVSRFHKQLQLRDEVQYGLRNFGVSGETSASLIRRSQLRAALDFIRTHDVRYITINIGANDLLGHLGSADCSEGLFAEACRQRIRDAMNAYERNLERILRDIRKEAPDATVIFLQSYNPFSLGFGARVALEVESNRILGEFNALAARIAKSHGVNVADGFTPMKDKAAAVTHMLDYPPDIHPKAIGYDIQAAALLDALP